MNFDHADLLCTCQQPTSGHWKKQRHCVRCAHFDLEDAVSPDAKDLARAQAVAAVN
jgi:citrate lyase beta subunit